MDVLGHGMPLKCNICRPLRIICLIDVRLVGKDKMSSYRLILSGAVLSLHAKLDDDKCLLYHQD